MMNLHFVTLLQCWHHWGLSFMPILQPGYGFMLTSLPAWGMPDCCGSGLERVEHPFPQERVNARCSGLACHLCIPVSYPAEKSGKALTAPMSFPGTIFLQLTLSPSYLQPFSECIWVRLFHKKRNGSFSKLCSEAWTDICNMYIILCPPQSVKNVSTDISTADGGNSNTFANLPCLQLRQ